VQLEQETSSRNAAEPGNHPSKSSFLAAALFNSPELKHAASLVRILLVYYYLCYHHNCTDWEDSPTWRLAITQICVCLLLLQLSAITQTPLDRHSSYRRYQSTTWWPEVGLGGQLFCCGWPHYPATRIHSAMTILPRPQYDVLVAKPVLLPIKWHMHTWTFFGTFQHYKYQKTMTYCITIYGLVL